jgi:hypothetical protein
LVVVSIGIAAKLVIFEMLVGTYRTSVSAELGCLVISQTFLIEEVPENV